MPSTTRKQKIGLILFGLFLGVVLIEGGLRLGGFIFYSAQAHKNWQAIKQRGTYRILCLGESTTGLGGEDSYPSQLGEILNQSNIGIKFSVINGGRPAGKIAYIVSQLSADLDKYNPHMVVTMLGINDVRDYKEDLVRRESKMTFLKSLRVFKLMNLILEHMKSKIEGLGKVFLDLTVHSSYADEIIPENDQGYFELAAIYAGQKRFDKAIELYEVILQREPQNHLAHSLLGMIYMRGDRDTQDFDKASEFLNKAVQLDPQNGSYLTILAKCYYVQGRYDEAEVILKDLIAVNPQDHKAYAVLANLNVHRGDTANAIEAVKAVIMINPSEHHYLKLAWLYNGINDYEGAEKMFHEATENYLGHRGYQEFADFYQRRKQIDKAEAIHKKALEMYADRPLSYLNLAKFYKSIGRERLSEEYLRKSEEILMTYYYPGTQRHYQNLKSIVIARGLQLVAVQYPVRKVGPLKAMLEPHEGTIFVDNEKVFKDAIKKDGPRAYFSDMFAVNFGHCTRKGNRLLAQNIADVILREVLNEKGRFEELAH